ncbi:LuxR family transcriptional regulator [Catellatospora methionotrophica]|uniref:LuxR family transcriptional regulator n=1 Tax=Catellatospora methionotrophica TaxID=121620 RepID=A0A8J3L8H7_9ACTN|nr:LuxR family transcriptional regulator [Catellatospora methionotrophica]GIG13634.1 LuxR family transcriptional regulator [Catellatospora methionotrophica]
MGPVSPVFVGRQGETDRLRALARQAVAGHGVAVLVEGEPGIGKTSLLDRVATDCASLGMRLLTGVAEDLEQQLPFAAIANCLGIGAATTDPELARVSGLLRGEQAFTQTLAAVNHDFVITEAILDLFDEWFAQGPVAMLLDDAQWADPQSLVVTHRLGRGIDQQPMLLVVATRSAPRAGPVDALERSLVARGGQVIELAPLPPSEIDTLAHDLLDADAGPRLRRLLATAGGNPMYVTELLAELADEGALGDRDGRTELVWDTDELAGGWVPPPLAEVILHRLGSLPPGVRDALQTAAVFGRTVDLTELSRALGRPLAELADVAASAVEAGILADTGTRLEFRQPLIREALAARVPPSARAALHARAAQQLGTDGSEVERIAEHLAAGDGVDERTARWLIEVADTLTARAPALAVDLLRRTLPHAPPPQASRLRLQLIRALLWRGEHAEAERVARAAVAAGDDPGGDGDVRWLLAQTCYRRGRLRESLEVIQGALAEGSGAAGLSEGERGRFHGFAAICLFFLGRFDEARAAAGQAVRAGAASGDARCIGIGDYALAMTLAVDGEMEQALAAADRAFAVLTEGVRPDLQVDPYTLRGMCLLELDRLAEADRALSAAVAANRESGGAYLPIAHTLRARLLFLDGRWDDALVEIETGIELPDLLGSAVRLRGMADLIAVHRGAAVDPPTGTGASYQHHFSRWARALCVESQQGPAAAFALLYPAWEKAHGLEPRRLVYRVCADLARFAVAAGDREQARALAREMDELVAQQTHPSLTATAKLCHGLADDDPDLLLAAAVDYHEAGWPLYEGNAYENAAEALARRDRPALARQTLDRALELYGALEATADIARAEARLRAVGVRRGVRGPRKRPKHGWDALTETERRVAALVAGGLSNPDVAAQMFLSRRTVQSHVSSILAKLQLSSRVELAVLAAERTAVRAGG